MIRPLDVIILLAGMALVALLAINVYSSRAAASLRVTQGNHDAREYGLATPRTIRVPGPLGTTLIEIEKGRARFIESPCTRKLCIRAGWLTETGQANACVPNRVSAVLLGADARFDAVSF